MNNRRKILDFIMDNMARYIIIDKIDNSLGIQFSVASLTYNLNADRLFLQSKLNDRRDFISIKLDAITTIYVIDNNMYITFK